MLRLLVVAVIVLLFIGVIATPVHADLDRAREEVEDLQGDLEATVLEYEETRAEAEQAADAVDRVEGEVAALDRDIEVIDRRLQLRARHAFVHGSVSPLHRGLVPVHSLDSIEQLSWVQVLYVREATDMESVGVSRVLRGLALGRAEQERARLEDLDRELDARRLDLEESLETAQGTLKELEERARREREAARAARIREVSLARAGSTGGYACPLDPNVSHFVDSWGWPRSGGRTHQGTDIMGPMGAPVYAFTSGVISRHSNSRLGGISLYIAANDGYTYFYAHLQAYAPKGAVGTRVQAGDHIAFNGNTGNARGGAPHIHFERHRGGASNPYPALAAACF